MPQPRSSSHKSIHSFDHMTITHVIEGCVLSHWDGTYSMATMFNKSESDRYLKVTKNHKEKNFITRKSSVILHGDR